MDKGLATEQAILQSAEREFMEKGFAGARTTSIAAGAGVTHTMLHYYYRTKEALFVKVVEQKFADMGDIVVDILKREDVNIIAKLEMVLTAHFRFLVDNPRMPLLLMSEYSNVSDKTHFINEVINAMYGNVVSHCRHQIEDAIKDGIMRQVSLENVLVDIVGLNIASVAISKPFSQVMGISSEEFLAMRLEENKKTLRYRITP